MSLLDLLDRPIAFHRIFVNLTGSVTAALMLSQAFYWSKRTSDPDGWFYKTQSEWEDETGMGRYEQEGARRVLKSLSFWEEKRVGIPAKLFYRINLPTLEGLLTSLIDKKPQTSMVESSSTECGKTTIKNGGFSHSIDIHRILTETTSEITQRKEEKGSFSSFSNPEAQAQEFKVEEIRTSVTPHYEPPSTLNHFEQRTFGRKRMPWGGENGPNTFDAEFCRFLADNYLASTPDFVKSGKKPEIWDSKSWLIKSKSNEERFDKAVLQWERFQESLQTPENLGKAIATQLRRLNYSGALPEEWGRRFQAQTVSDLSAAQQVEYLNWLKSQEIADVAA